MWKRVGGHLDNETLQILGKYRMPLNWKRLNTVTKSETFYFFFDQNKNFALIMFDFEEFVYKILDSVFLKVLYTKFIPIFKITALSVIK